MSASESEEMSESGAESEEGTDNSEDSMQESGSEASDEEDEVLEPKVLPPRGTRGNRMNTLIAEEDSADEEFWQQDFFAEEGKDEEYEKSSEGEDEADTDFSESESESDEEEQDQKEIRTTRPKALKPPGAKRPPTTRAKQPLSDEARALQAEQKAERLAQLAIPGEAPTLRHSTRVRVEEAQQVRQRAEKVKPKRIRPVVEQRPLTQDELLAEAAHTELDNLRDLEQMVALEEATKKKAMYKRSKYSGPMIRFHSKKVGEVALTMVEVVNMLPPPYMLPSTAPKPTTPLRCAVTGKPAKYRDPVSGYGYADLEAYKELKQRLQSERRGLTGKRTKRQSTKPASLPQSSQQLGADAVPAQLDASAAQGAVAAAPSIVSTAVNHKPRQSAAESEAAVASDAAASAVAASAAVLIPAQGAAAATAVPAASPSQTTVVAIQPPAAPSFATANASTDFPQTVASPAIKPIDPASSAQQGSQVAQAQFPAAAPSAAAVGAAAIASGATGKASLPGIHIPGAATAKAVAVDTPAQLQVGSQDAAVAGPSNVSGPPATNQADGDVAVPMET